MPRARLDSAPFEIEYPYVHSTGPAIGRFLGELRDSRKILGRRCPQCRIVVVPAQDYCERCASDLGEWVEVADSGVLVSWTVVRRPTRPDLPLPYPHSLPFAYALVRLDGADTALLHTLKTKDYSRLREGLRVRAVWKEQREGSILDLSHFEIAEAE